MNLSVASHTPTEDMALRIFNTKNIRGIAPGRRRLVGRALCTVAKLNTTDARKKVNRYVKKMLGLRTTLKRGLEQEKLSPTWQSTWKKDVESAGGSIGVDVDTGSDMQQDEIPDVIDEIDALLSELPAWLWRDAVDSDF